MFEWLQMIWQWTIQPVPLILALSLYFGPSFFRQLRYFAYTPLYFSLYPLSYIKNDVVSRYVGSKYYPPFLQAEDEAEKLRKKTSLTIAISTMLDTILIPVCIAFLWSLFLNTAQFITALVFLLLIQASRFLKSMLTVHKHIYGSSQFRKWLAAVYIIALFCISLSMLETWHWVTSSLAEGGYIFLFWNVTGTLWGFIPIAIVSAVSGFIINSVLLDKKMRQNNLHGNQNSASQRVTSQHPTPKRPKRTDQS